MTIAGWIGFAFLCLLIIGGIALISLAISDATNKEFGEVFKKARIVGAILCVCLLVGMLWYYNSTEEGKRAFHTQESNLNGGLNRKVTVYDAIGNVLYEYEGRIDVEYENGKVLFDDESGKRHVIYYNTGTAIVEEKEE